MDTLDVLEEVLANYDGTIILVSHDRAFLDNVVTSTLAPLGDGRWLETSGGWSDLEGQGLKLISKINKNPIVKKAPPPPPPPKVQTRLSYKDNFRLEELGKLMPQFEEKIQTLETQLHDPQLYQKDRAKFDKLSQELEVCRQKLEDMEYEWLELEEKKASLSSS